MSLPLAQLVRAKVTDDRSEETGVTDAEIDAYLILNDDDVDLAIADALETLASRRPYKSVTRGQVKEESIDPVARAEIYRRRAELAAVRAGQATTIDMATLSRTDLGIEESTEYSYG